jgi:hypothetical protein
MRDLRPEASVPCYRKARDLSHMREGSGSELVFPKDAKSLGI